MLMDGWQTDNYLDSIESKMQNKTHQKYKELNMNENNYVRAIHITEGQKIWMPNKDSCYELEKKLNSIGIETRVGNTCGTNLWSIYIISVPDILVDACRTI